MFYNAPTEYLSSSYTQRSYAPFRYTDAQMIGFEVGKKTSGYCTPCDSRRTITWQLMHHHTAVVSSKNKTYHVTCSKPIKRQNNCKGCYNITYAYQFACETSLLSCGPRILTGFVDAWLNESIPQHCSICSVWWVSAGHQRPPSSCPQWTGPMEPYRSMVTCILHRFLQWESINSRMNILIKLKSLIMYYLQLPLRSWRPVKHIIEWANLMVNSVMKLGTGRLKQYLEKEGWHQWSQ